MVSWMAKGVSRARRGQCVHGFTLLELMVVLTIMILLAAMVYPAAGMLNDRQRVRITEERMREIRRAMVGDPDRFDGSGLRIIGGYVGDMGVWPDLYEAAPEVKKSVLGVPPPFDPADANNPTVYYYRPSGSFIGHRWRWNLPHRKLTDDTFNNSDHIGGLETENEGQPLGLWTDNPRGDSSEILDPALWKGPYLVPPKDTRPEDDLHLAVRNSEYDALDPAYDIHLGDDTWEDGDYSPTNSSPGEYHDDKEKFRLMQTDDRLEDGWNRALRFFITADPDHPGGTIFWIVSEGPDQEATYPTKGSCVAGSWAVDVTDTMGMRYDPNAPYNQDNIVMKIYSHEWQAIIDAVNLRKRQQTEALFTAIRRALVGESSEVSGGFNTGYTGGLCRWPSLFRWEDNGTPVNLADDHWDDRDGDVPPKAYTKGQPRGLWTDTPNSAEVADNLTRPSPASPGIGWSGPYLASPLHSGARDKLVDGWGREILFFMDVAHDSLLVLSRGPDGRFDFGDTDTLPTGAPDGSPDYLEPGRPTEAVDNTTYNPNDPNGFNADNLVMVIKAEVWKPAWFILDRLVVENATAGLTKAMFVYGYDGATGQLERTVYTAGIDGTLLDGTWTMGDTAPNQAFVHDALTNPPACAGTRVLVVWNDADDDNQVDSQESWKTLPYNLFTHNGLEPRSLFTIDTLMHFTPAP